MRKFPLISIMLFFAGCESYTEKISTSSICEGIRFLIDEIALIASLLVILAFIPGIAACILHRWKMKNILYFWLLCLFAFFLLLANAVLFPRLECRHYRKHAPTEFFKIKEEKSEDNNSISEYFVISNPPNDTLLLRKIVEEYNFRTIPVDELRKYERYEREFYRETKCLTRNYEEGKPYPELQAWVSFGFPFTFELPCTFEHSGHDPGQQIGYHSYSKDQLMITYYSYFSRDSGGFWQYSYHYGHFKYRHIIIKDIDLFYEENMKESSGTR